MWPFRKNTPVPIAASAPTAAELRQELFALLKEGDLEKASSDRYKDVNFDNCIVNIDDADKSAGHANYYASKERKECLKFFYRGLSDLNDLSVESRKNFFDFHGSFSANYKQLVYPLSYFVKAGDQNAVSFLLARAADVNEGQDRFDARSFCRAIYFCLTDAAMMELLLESGAKPSKNLVIGVLQKIRSVDEDTIKPLQVLLQHGVNAKLIFETAKSMMIAKDFEELQNLLTVSTAIVAPVAVQPVNSVAAATAPPSFVRIDKDYAGIKTAEVYDFETCERKTFNVSPNGEHKLSLRESFNDMGRDDRGLKAAIATYQEKGGVFDADDFFLRKIDKPLYTL